MREPNFIPENMDKELDLRCDAGQKLFNDLWSVLMRHTLEDSLTFWEVLGALDVLSVVYKQRFLAERPENPEAQEL